MNATSPVVTFNVNVKQDRMTFALTGRLRGVQVAYIDFSTSDASFLRQLRDSIDLALSWPESEPQNP